MHRSNDYSKNSYEQPKKDEHYNWNCDVQRRCDGTRNNRGRNNERNFDTQSWYEGARTNGVCNSGQSWKNFIPPRFCNSDGRPYEQVIYRDRRKSWNNMSTAEKAASTNSQRSFLAETSLQETIWKATPTDLQNLCVGRAITKKSNLS